MLLCVAVYYNATLQHTIIQVSKNSVVVWYSVLQRVAVGYSGLHFVAVRCSAALEHKVTQTSKNSVAACCSVLQCVAVCYSAPQCIAVSCSAEQYVAVRCSMMKCRSRTQDDRHEQD